MTCQDALTGRTLIIERGFTLRTDLFEATTPGPHFINERCFGEDFAIWLSERLQAHGLTPSAPVQEDFGWVLLIPFQGHTFTLTIGIMDESIGQVPSEWRVGVAFEKPLNGVRSWFRAAPLAELAQLAGILESSLKKEPRILQIEPG